MTKHKLEKSAIFKLEPKRALEVLDILEMLAGIGKATSYEAKRNGLTIDEWGKAHHFFLTSSAKNLPKIRAILKSMEQLEIVYERFEKNVSVVDDFHVRYNFK